MSTQIEQSKARKALITQLWSEGLCRAEIADRIGRCTEVVAKVTRYLPDNGTYKLRGWKTVGGEGSWPRRGNMTLEQIADCYAGQRYEDARLVARSTIPMDGNRLKFAARVRNITYGVGANYGA